MADVGESYITQDIYNDICTHIRSGLSVRKYPFGDHNITERSFYAWVDVHATEPQLQQYLRAREGQADVIFDECLDIADNATDDIIFLVAADTDGDGAKPAIKHSAIARANLQINTRMRMAGKLRPKKYGERVVNQHEPGEGLKEFTLCLKAKDEDAE